MEKRTTVVSRAGLLALALLALSCTESAGPDRAPYLPSFSYSPNGVTFSKAVGTLDQRNTQLLVKGFNLPTGNPHHGDAVIATFFWIGSTPTNIIDSVVDVVTTNPYTRVGNTYRFVRFIHAANYSMATYYATNVQGFPDPNTDPGGSDVYAVAAYLSQQVADGGVTLSAYTGVEDDFTAALGNHSASSGTGSSPMFAHADPIGVNADAVVYTATISGVWGLDAPQGYQSRNRQGADGTFKMDAADQIQASAGTADPQWGWFFGSSDTWLVTTLALNRAPPPTQSPGNLTATTTTSGSSPDPDGYIVTVDGGASQPIGVNGSVTFTGLTAGNHSVALSGLASNCAVSGSNPQTVNVPSGGTATAAFTVNCSATTGDLAVNTTSSGSSIPSSYTATVDGSQSQTVASTGSVTFTNLSAASHTVVLSVPANCTVSGGASQTTTVPAGGTATVSYSVSCVTPPGNLTATTSTSGSNLDPDGYTVTVDGSTSQAIGINASVTFTNLSAGSHSVQLTGVAANCTVSGSNPRSISVPSGGTGTTTFTVSCVTPPGNLNVSTSTSGSSLDPDGYTVTVDGGSAQAIGINATVSYTNLAAGNHTVVMSGVAANCTVSGGTSRTVSVPSGGTGTTTFTVSCTTPNQAPVVNAGSDETVILGLLYTTSFSFSDPDNGPWSYTIDWGDGSQSTGSRASAGSFSASHTYLGILTQRTIRVTVRDNLGASGSDTRVITLVL